MRPVADWQLADVLALIVAAEPESLTLEYKRSEALCREERDEISKDIFGVRECRW